MARQLTPQEKDRLAAEGRDWQPPPAAIPPNERAQPATGSDLSPWLWALVGVIVLVAIAGGVMLGFFGGRLLQWQQRPAPTPQPRLAWMLGAELADTPDGAQIAALDAGGAAQVAGLLPGDVLVSVDGQTVLSAAEVRAVVERHEPGDRVLVVVRRDFRSLELPLVLGAAAPVPVVTAAPVTPVQPGAYQSGRLGIAYRMVQPGDPFPADQGALIINFLDEDTPAELAGLQPGDIITHVEGAQVTAWRDLGDALSRLAPGVRVEMIVVRAGEEMAVAVELG